MVRPPAPYEKPLRDCTVAIAGLGLMGGSLALALRGSVAHVVGIARRPETVQQALAMGAIDEGHTTLAAGVANADIIVLGTPVSVILSQVEEIGRLAAAGAVQNGVVLLDMGSTKRQVCRALATLPASVEPIGAHPMCGKENPGIDEADADLYRNAPFILSPLDRTAPQAVALVETLALAVGARPLCMDPTRHDWLVAAISHLPYLLSVALFATADGVSQSDRAVWQLAAGGFRSATRLAGSEEKMMADILLSNADAVLQTVAAFQDNLAELMRLVRDGDEQSLRTVAATVRSLRQDFLHIYGA